jgi:hypothetical protein
MNKKLFLRVLYVLRSWRVEQARAIELAFSFSDWANLLNRELFPPDNSTLWICSTCFDAAD